MKIKLFSVLVISAIVLYTTNSCKEVDVLTKSTTEVALLDTTYLTTTIEAPEAKVSVLEEFTGVRCINCAPGHAEAKSIKTSNPGRVITIAHHSHFLDDPYPYSYKNLTSDDAEEISNFIGPVSSKPTAAIDRKLYTGESSKILDKVKWSNKVNDQLLLTSPVNIHLTSSFNALDTSAILTFTAHFTQSVSDPLKFSIMLTESEIITAQLLPTMDVDTNYVHEEVLRDVLTEIEGNSLGTATLEPGRVFVKQYRVKINSDWNPDHMYVIAFIHKTGSSYEILQASEIPLK